MRIAVLSGKGGTGKTLVAVNLAAAANTATYIDCDVEEPNGYLFLSLKASGRSSYSSDPQGGCGEVPRVPKVCRLLHV